MPGTGTFRRYNYGLALKTEYRQNSMYLVLCRYYDISPSQRSNGVARVGIESDTSNEKVRNIADVATVSYVDFISYLGLFDASPDFFLGQTLCGVCQHGIRSSLGLV
jgi:hypothetical protein